MQSFFDKIPDMECLRGDTLGDFVISSDSGDFSGSMQVIIARKDMPAIAVICKDCELIDGEFHVVISSEDTEKLGDGMYMMHFRLIDENGNSYRKLMGNLYVHQTAQGGE